MTKVKAIAIMIVTAVLFTLYSCNDKTPVESNVVDDYFLPTVPAPSGGWTAEELDLIQEYGAIEEVTIPNELRGNTRTVTYTVEKGEPMLDCAGAYGYCDLISEEYTEDEGGPDLDTVIVKWVDDVECFKITSNDGDTVPGVTTNGLLPISGFLFMSDSSCTSLGLSTVVIYPGLYIIESDSANIIYVYGLIEE